MFTQISNVYDNGLALRSDLEIGMALYTMTNRAPGAGNNGYTKAIKTPHQLDVLQQLGCTTYRMECACTLSGSMNNPTGNNYDAWLKDTLAQTRSRGLKAILLIIDKCSSFYGSLTSDEGKTIWQDDKLDFSFTEEELVAVEQAAYQGGVDMLTGFLNIYGSLISDADDILEMGNEPELFKEIQKAAPGTNASQFNPQKLRIWKWHVKGMVDGAKAARPNLKVSTPASAGWFCVYMYDQLVQLVTNFDYLSWHWYSDMTNIMISGGVPNSSSTRNIFQYLWNRYQLPMIFTEVNARGATHNGANDGPESNPLHQCKQVRHFRNLIIQANAVPQVHRLTFYKQLSDPIQSYPTAVGGSNSYGERSYGLFYFGDNFEADPNIVPRNQQDFQKAFRPKAVINCFKYTLKGGKYDILTQNAIQYGMANGLRMTSCLYSIDKFIKTLRTAGVIDKLDVMYIFSQHLSDPDFKLINWLDPTKYKATANGGVVYNNLGILGNATDAYVDTNFNPAVHSVNYTLNNACRIAWVHTTAVPNGNSGYIDGVIGSGANNMSSAQSGIQRINQGSTTPSGVVLFNGNGYRSIQRESDTIVRRIYNTTWSGDVSSPSTEILSTNQVLMRSNNNFANLGLSFYALGAALTQEQHTVIRDAFTAYRVEIGITATDQNRV